MHLKGEVNPVKNVNFIYRSVRGTASNGQGPRCMRRLNNCVAPAPDIDDVLVVAAMACPAYKNTSSSTTKTSSLSGAGAAQLFNRLYIQYGLSHAPRTFTIRLSAGAVPSDTRPNGAAVRECIEQGVVQYDSLVSSTILPKAEVNNTFSTCQG